jgi:acetamidase/formamidase
MATHHFTPTRYYTTIGWHEPALRIGDGDTVVTTTVDARGKDASDEVVTPRGNPQTGPFYVEGAEPGDTLAVRLERIAPNRRRGWSSSTVASNVLDPEFVASMPEREAIDWEIDSAARTATLAKPAGKLGMLSLALDPMLGCFGVAPAGMQAISCATSGAHGGNMDYRGFRESVTVYFPVSAPGALLHVGDAHAVQGDGEIVGTGVEVSAEVQFTVRVLKGKRIENPRGENADYIFAVGNARPLDQCVQIATTEMLKWLQSEYGLDLRSASILLGQAVEYDLGNIYDPAYTMVCKVAKRYLPDA